MSSARLEVKSSFALLLGIILAAWLLLGSPATLLATSFDLTPGGDFGPGGTYGASLTATKPGLTLTLTALTGLNPSSLDLTSFNSGGGPGVVYIAEDPAVLPGLDLGAGVKKPQLPGQLGPSGSSGISGTDGPKGDEALILTFSPSLNLSLVSLTLVDYQPIVMSGLVDVGDDVEIYLDSMLSSPILGHLLIEDNLSCNGATCTLDFSNPAFGTALTGISSFTTMYVRASQGNFFVSGVDVGPRPMPEPGTLLLLGSGLAGLGLWRARKIG